MRAVALGGGHGLAVSLEALRMFATEVTAVVGVADNGGSSGRLREFWSECPALGDTRLTISNLLGHQSKLGNLLEYRFQTGDLAGHALGNLILFGLVEKTGALSDALTELTEIAQLTTRVLPVSNAPLELHGRDANGERLVGQLAVHWSPAVAEVWVSPPVEPFMPVIDAVEAADVVVLGPGSLFTSVLATALSPGVPEALARTRAQVVFVANLAPQEAETRGYDLAKTLDALRHHGIATDVVVVHRPGSIARDASVSGVRIWEGKLSEDGVRHRAALLAAALQQVTEAAS